MSDDCYLCGGTGEVEITDQHEKVDVFGCPLCMSKEHEDVTKAHEDVYLNSEKEASLLHCRIVNLEEALKAVHEQCIEGRVFTQEIIAPSHWRSRVEAALSSSARFGGKAWV